ncbi:MFS transporter [Paenibacillus chungangensis]|uniref:MFS transporter n=1 Tax=Paenibacillus chungangensis TaxID=696535 RepID=A0ABW3HWE7_9BACL
MEKWKRTMWILWIGVLFCSASYTMSVPFLPLFLFDLGVQESSVNLWAGIVHSSAFLVGAVMAPLWGMLADKYGKRMMVIRAGLSLAVIYALIAFVQTPEQLVGARMLHGFVGGFVPASMSIVASIAPKQQLGWSLGMMQAGAMTGGILGPLFGGVLAELFGLRNSFIAAAAIILGATIAVIVWVRESAAGQAASGEKQGKKEGRKDHGKEHGKQTQQEGDNQGAAAPAKAEPITFRMAFRNRSLVNMLLLLVVFQLSINMIQPLMALHIADMSGSGAGSEGVVLSAGLVLSLIGIAGILASPLWGRLGERKGYYRILVLCFMCAGTVICMQYFVEQLWLFAIVQFVFGLFMAGIGPIVNTLMVQSTDEQFRGRTFGLTASANQFGGMLGPLIGGVLGMALNIHWIFVTTGVIMMMAGLAVWRMRHTTAKRTSKVHVAG